MGGLRTLLMWARVIYGIASAIGWKPFLGAASDRRRREELRRLKRELEVMRQEPDIVKKTLMVFSRTQEGDSSFFEITSQEYPVNMMCRLLAMSESGSDVWRCRVPSTVSWKMSA